MVMGIKDTPAPSSESVHILLTLTEGQVTKLQHHKMHRSRGPTDINHLTVFFRGENGDAGQG